MIDSGFKFHIRTLFANIFKLEDFHNGEEGLNFKSLNECFYVEIVSGNWLLGRILLRGKLQFNIYDLLLLTILKKCSFWNFK